ncbi:exosortase/archaeosortase family protein [Desulfosarcina cetonica]|uniref:exosortase/archaeosortase family protein n=1 Tax=Desulfosarcina cetonica TaxID=90730 RepID=UPI0006D0A211
MAAALTVIPVSLIPEPWYRPLNQLTASLAGNLIRLMGTDPVVRSTHISLGDFSVNVISECSAVHLIALYAAFIYAFPTGRPQKWVGFGAGVAMILSVNIIRVAAVTMIGRYSLKLFEVSHIYLGQLGMLATVVFICLFWCRWASDPDAFDGPAGYFLRFLLFSCLPFLLWLPLNRAYQKVIDGFVEKLFSAASYTLTIPRTHSFTTKLSASSLWLDCYSRSRRQNFQLGCAGCFTDFPWRLCFKSFSGYAMFGYRHFASNGQQSFPKRSMFCAFMHYL